MARKPARKKNEQVANATAKLVEALRFVSLAQANTGSLSQTHIRLVNHTATAFNDVLAIGCKIEEELNACPHTYRLIDALKQCGESLAITQLDSGRLSIKSGAFKALVPCADPYALPVAYPDPPCADIDDRLRKGLAAVADLATEGAQHVVTASILLGPNTVSATDRKLMLQYWHGIDLPPDLVLPKASVAALLKIDKPMVKLGFSSSSVTFYFEDESWLKTQLYSERWPDLDKVLNVSCNAWPVPTDLFKGLNAVIGFSENNNVYFDNGLIKSHLADGVGATYEVAGTPNKIAFCAKSLKLLENLITTIDIQGVNRISYFFGENLRGAIVQIVH